VFQGEADAVAGEEDVARIVGGEDRVHAIAESTTEAIRDVLQIRDRRTQRRAEVGFRVVGVVHAAPREGRVGRGVRIEAPGPARQAAPGVDDLAQPVRARAQRGKTPAGSPYFPSTPQVVCP